MSDDDFIWLISALKRGSYDFQTLYNVSFNISDLIILDRGEPKSWFYMTPKKRIRLREEEFLKFKVIREYFNNPNITVKQALEIDTKEPDYNQKYYKQTKYSDYDNELIFYYYSQYTKDQQSFQILRPVSRRIAQDLFEKPAENMEFLTQWQKIIPYKLLNQNGKTPQLFQVQFVQNFEKSSVSSTVYRKTVENVPLEKKEFQKSDAPKQMLTFEEKIYKSISSIVNEKCNDFVKAVVRYLENQYKEVVESFTLDFFLTQTGQIYLSGVQKLVFFDQYGDISTTDKQNMEVAKPEQPIPYKCPGIYCGIEGNNIFYNPNDEAFSLFVNNYVFRFDSLISIFYKIPQSKDDSMEEHKFIQKKSIVIDVVERFKTIQMIQEVAPNINITEQLIFKCRKFYSLSDMAGSLEFNHLRVDNFYHRVRVCYYCYYMYSKLDSMRLQSQGQMKRKNLTKKQVMNTIADLKGENGILDGNLMSDIEEKNKFSKRFKEKLKEFKIEHIKFAREFDVQKQEDANYFYKKFEAKNKTIYGDIDYQKDSKIRKNFYLSQSQEKFQLPKITAYTLTDKNSMIFKKQFFVDKNDAEALGLKHYLGHTKNLPYSDCGLAISKSSLALNRLQDKIQEVQKIREKMEADKLKYVRQEIDMMLCPYYGNGQSDKQKLKQFVDKLKEREEGEEYKREAEEEEMRKKQVQVVTDKHEFLSENQKKIKQDKEKKDKEIESEKKNFLEEHKHLAESIVKKSKIVNAHRYNLSKTNSPYYKFNASNTSSPGGSVYQFKYKPQQSQPSYMQSQIQKPSQRSITSSASSISDH